MAEDNKDPINRRRREFDAELLHAVLDLLKPKKERDRRLNNEARRLTERQVCEVIDQYQLATRQTVRWSDIREDLKEIGARANVLKQRISQARAVSVSRLGANRTLRPLFRARQDADGRPIVDAGPWSDEFRDGAAESEILDLLNLISSIAQQETKELPVGAGKQAPYPEPDHAERELVRECLRLFETYRPGEASTTVGGDFREFVSRIYEMATGKSEVDLTRRVRQAIADHKAAKSTSSGSRGEIIAEMNRARRKPER